MTPGTFQLRPALPFRLDLTVWTLRRRRGNIVDRWDGTTYCRVLSLPTGPVRYRETDYFNRSKVFWRICAAVMPANLDCAFLMTSASFSFFVGRFTL